jgi:hypothetical protein
MVVVLLMRRAGRRGSLRIEGMGGREVSEGVAELALVRLIGLAGFLRVVVADSG